MASNARTRAVGARAKLTTRYAAATTGRARLAAVTDYVRSAAAAVADLDPVLAEEVLTGLVGELLRGGDVLIGRLDPTLAQKATP